MKKNILKVCDITMFYPLEHPSGVKTYIEAKRSYCKGKQNITHVLIVPGKEDHKQVTDNLMTHYVKSPQLYWNKSYRLLNSYSKIKKILLEEKPDIIELGDVYLLPWFVRRIVKKNRLKAKVVGFYHADFPQRDLYRIFSFFKPLALMVRAIGKRYAAFAYNKLDACLVSSRSIKDKLKAWGLKTVFVTPFGIPTQMFKQQQQNQKQIPTHESDLNRPIKALYCGRIAAEKGIIEFISVAHTINANKRYFDLTIIGAGNLETHAQNLAQSAPYIYFLPFIADKKALIEQYTKHDLLIVPCVDETFGLSALEALAAGTPVAALNGLGGVEEFVNEKTGFLLGMNIESYIDFFQTTYPQSLQAMRPSIQDYILKEYEISKRFDHQFETYRTIIAKH